MESPTTRPFTALSFGVEPPAPAIREHAFQKSARAQKPAGGVNDPRASRTLLFTGLNYTWRARPLCVGLRVALDPAGCQSKSLICAHRRHTIREILSLACQGAPGNVCLPVLRFIKRFGRRIISRAERDGTRQDEQPGV